MSHASIFFFFNDTATTEIYTLSLHDALPILAERGIVSIGRYGAWIYADIEMTLKSGISAARRLGGDGAGLDSALTLFSDRKSTRLNSSHANISYAVFCLKKKKQSAATSS